MARHHPHDHLHRSARRSLRVVAAAALLLALAAGSAPPAAAGGWAVGSLDAVPVATAGETATVGFTILQHGVTPAELADDVGIEIIGPDGTVEYFPAAADGTPGHYVASVTFPDEHGAYAWNIRMGWFGAQELGALDVLSADAGGASLPWQPLRWVLLALTAVFAALAIAGLRPSRRKAPATIG